MTKIKTERNFGAVIPFSELNIGDVFVSKDNNENLYIKICESTDELNMSNNTIGIGQAYTMFTENAESTTTISFKELKNGDIFIGGPQQRIYMKMAEAHHTNYDGEQTTMNAVRLGTGCLAHFSDEYNVALCYNAEIKCE